MFIMCATYGVKSTRSWLALSRYRCHFIGDGYQTIIGHSMVGHRSSRGKGSRAQQGKQGALLCIGIVAAATVSIGMVVLD